MVQDPAEAHTLSIQLVLFHLGFARVLSTVQSVVAASAQARRTGHVSEFVVTIGDSSETPCLTNEEVASLERLVGNTEGELRYQFFGENLGSAEGSNRLAAGTSSDLVMVLNPDTYLHPRCLSMLITALEQDDIGIAEGRQLPIEHPKTFDPVTGDTSWASGSCLMVKREVFERVNGFDGEHFFLHCDDVDFSWRVRLAGWRVVHVPGALVYHDKRIDLSGRVFAPDVEKYYGLLGRLMLCTRYARSDILGSTISSVEARADPVQLSALGEYLKRATNSQIPAAFDAAEASKVAEFIRGNYAVHRF